MLEGTTRTAKEAAKEANKKAQETLTPGQLYAINIAGRNVKNGAFWGYTTVEDVKEFASSIKENKNMRVRRLGEHCIIEVDPNYVINSVLSIDKDLFDDEDMEYIKDNLANAVIEFEKFLVNKGITEEGWQGVVAIYCTNKVTSVAHKGVHYPAFRLNLSKVLTMLGTYGYQIKVNGQFISAEDAIQHLATVWDSMKVSPTKTGAFIEIKATLQPDQYREIKRQLKEKYNG